MRPSIAALLAPVVALASCHHVEPPAAPAPVATETPSVSAAASATAAPDPPSPAPSATAVATAAPVVAAPALPPVELVLVEPSPSPSPPPALTISAPSRGQVIPAKKAAAFALALSVKGWKLAPGGDHLCVVLDRRACRRVDDLARPIRLGDLDAQIDEGQHVISVIARRASGEFVRPSGKAAPFASTSFFVGKKVPTVHKDGAPMLFFSPLDGPAPAEGALVDFYLANGELGDGKLVVLASVGGPGIEQGVGLAVQANKPMRLRNARPGEYLSRVSLSRFQPDLGESKSATTVTYTPKPVEGPFSEATRTFHVGGR